MMTNRRTPTGRVPFLPQHYPGGQTIAKTCNCKSLEELCQVWNVRFSLYESKTTTGRRSEDVVLPAGEHRYSDAYNLLGEEPSSAAAASSNNANGSANDNSNNKAVTTEDASKGCSGTQPATLEEPATKRLKV